MSSEFKQMGDGEGKEYRERQKERLKKAMDSLSEHFTGVVILAHEVHGDGGTDRYVRTAGDPLALRYHAVLWSRGEEVLEQHKMIIDYINWLHKRQEPPDENAPQD